LAAALPSVSAGSPASQIADGDGDAAADAAALVAAVAAGDNAAERTAAGIGQEVPPEASRNEAAPLGQSPPIVARAAAFSRVGAANRNATDGGVSRHVAQNLGRDAPRGVFDFSLEHVSARHGKHEAAREALFASLSEHAGTFGSWLQFYALPRNLVSLHNAIQTLLAECDDVDQAIAGLIEPGVEPWLEWAVVAVIAAEAARRAAGRQSKQRAGSLDQQLLHLFPELFGLAYGVR
jgi:hypothetical protein